MKCNDGVGEHPIYDNVDMKNGATSTTWIDALQVNYSSISERNEDEKLLIVLFIGVLRWSSGIIWICGRDQLQLCFVLYAVWKKWGAIPERFNWQRKEPDVSFYPLRPEFAESTYLLYQVCINFCVACLKVLQSPTIRQPKIRFI